jgi:hypothetical protein
LEQLEMATNNSSKKRGENRGRGGRNNPEGHNQYSGVMAAARNNPLAAAAAVGGAVAAGVFLWSRRNQVSDQIGNLSDQISGWRDGRASDSGIGDDTNTGETRVGDSDAPTPGRSQAEIAEEALTLKEIGATA